MDADRDRSSPGRASISPAQSRDPFARLVLNESWDTTNGRTRHSVWDTMNPGIQRMWERCCEDLRVELAQSCDEEMELRYQLQQAELTCRQTEQNVSALASSLSDHAQHLRAKRETQRALELEVSERDGAVLELRGAFAQQLQAQANLESKLSEYENAAAELQGGQAFSKGICAEFMVAEEKEKDLRLQLEEEALACQRKEQAETALQSSISETAQQLLSYRVAQGSLELELSKRDGALAELRNSFSGQVQANHQMRTTLELKVTEEARIACKLSDTQACCEKLRAQLTHMQNRDMLLTCQLREGERMLKQVEDTETELRFHENVIRGHSVLLHNEVQTLSDSLHQMHQEMEALVNSESLDKAHYRELLEQQKEENLSSRLLEQAVSSKSDLLQNEVQTLSDSLRRSREEIAQLWHEESLEQAQYSEVVKRQKEENSFVEENCGMLHNAVQTLSNSTHVSRKEFVRCAQPQTHAQVYYTEIDAEVDKADEIGSLTECSGSSATKTQPEFKVPQDHRVSGFDISRSNVAKVMLSEHDRTEAGQGRAIVAQLERVLQEIGENGGLQKKESELCISSVAHALHVCADCSERLTEKILLALARLSVRSKIFKRKVLMEAKLKPVVLKLFSLHQEDAQLQGALCKFLSVVLLDDCCVTAYFDPDITDYVFSALEMHFDEPAALGYICHSLSSILHCEMQGADGRSILRSLANGGVKRVMNGFAKHFQNRIPCFGALQLLNTLAKYDNHDLFEDFLNVQHCCRVPQFQNAAPEKVESPELSSPEIILYAMAAHSGHAGVQQLGILLLQYCLTSLCFGDALSQLVHKLQLSPVLSQALLHCKNAFGPDSSMGSKASLALAYVSYALRGKDEKSGTVLNGENHALDMTHILNSGDCVTFTKGGC